MIQETVESLVKTREKVDLLKTELEQAKQLEVSLESLLISEMNESDLKSITSNGLKITITKKTFISVNKADNVALFAWLKDHNMESMISTDVNRNSLKGAMKDYIEEHPDEELPEFFKQFSELGLSIRKEQ